jgi:hypothetical protein
MKRFSIVAVSSLLPAILGAQTATHSVVVPAPATTLPLKHAAEPTTAAITARDLMTRLYIFADDSMQGREAGTIGNVKGTDYIAAEARRIGLVPAGDNGTYFQTIPFKTRTIAPTSTLTLGGAPLTYGTDWVVSTTAALSRDNVPVIFGGTLGDSASMLPVAQAAGKIVVYRVPARGFNFRLLRVIGAYTPNAVAVALVGADQMMARLARPTTFVDDAGIPARVTAPVVYLTAAAAPRLFATPADSLRAGAAGAMASINVVVNVAPVAYPARNVVGILPGSDAKLKGEYVAIGAHNDHIGFTNRPVDHDSIRIFNHLVRPGGAEDAAKQATPDEQAQVNAQLAAWRTAHPGTARLDSISNGADDDGTGSVSVLEIAQKLAAMPRKPKRSVIFVWHVGEEKGLLGSAYFTDHPTVPRDSIVAQLNMDMEGRGDAWDQTGLTKDGQPIHGGPNYLQLVGSRRLSTELGNLVEQVNTSGKHGFQFDYSLDANGHPMNIYCRSDHYEYARYGIPVVFFTTGGHSDYHQVTDEPEYIDYEHMARVGNLVSDIAVAVANLDHRPVVDQPKPDPTGSCRQ